MTIILASPGAAQSDPAGEFLCEDLGDGGWLRTVCSEVVDDTTLRRLDLIQELADHYTGTDLWMDEIAALPSGDADPTTRRSALAAMRYLLESNTTWLGRLHDGLGVWLERRVHLEASIEVLRELPGLPPEFAVAINTVPMADFRAATARGERMRADIEARLAELEELLLTIDELLEEVDIEIQNVPVATAFDGVWSTTYGDELILIQEGFKVTGTYDYDGGRVQFDVVDEFTLDGFWVEDGSRLQCESSKLGSEHWGRLRLEFSEDFTSYAGLWDYCENEPLRGTSGGWLGDFIRARGTQPDG